MADRISLDLGYLRWRIAEHPQRFRDRAVDNLEIAAARELLEFDQRKVGLDAGGIAIHDQADGAGRGDHRDLRIAIAVLLAQRKRAVPGALGMLDHACVRTGLVVERNRRRGNPLKAGALAMRRAAVIADDAQHVLAILLEPGEPTKRP